MKYLTYLLILCTLWTMTSCDDDSTSTTMPSDGDRTPQYAGGTFIVNQGPFQSGTGTLTYYRNDTTEQLVYQASNGGDILGNIAQSLLIVDTVALITINNGSAVIAASAIDLGKMYSIDIDLPRYMAPIDEGLAAISYWGATGQDGGVRVINVHTGETIYDIATGNAPEKIAVIDEQLYIPLGNGFGRGSGLLIIDAATGTTITTLVTADGPHTVLAGRADTVWVVAQGYTDFNDSANNTEGAIHGIVNLQVVTTTTIANGTSLAEISPDGDMLYLIDNAGLLGLDNGTRYNQDYLVTGFYYGMRVDPSTGELWLCNAGDFTNAGTVEVLSPTGQLLKTIVAGVVPGDIHFYGD